MELSIFFAYLLPSYSKNLEIQGNWVLRKTSATVLNCPNPIKSFKTKYDPKIAIGAKIHKNAISKGSLSTLEFRPF